MGTLAPFLLGLVVAAVVFVPFLLAARSRAVAVAAQAGALKQELGGLSQSKAALEADQAFLTAFIQDFPHLARDLFTGLRERQVPLSVLRVIQETFDPAAAVVLVRRGFGEQGLEDRFVVAAVVPERGLVPLGDDVPVADGRPSFPPSFSPELLAPLVFDQETLGMVALSRPRKTRGDVTAALRLIAQTGAQALRNAALNTPMRVTAEMDGLTRIFNKKHMEQALSEMVYRAACAARGQREPGAPRTAPFLSVFLFDIDHFKHYNDTNGHLAGDRLLQDLAQLVPRSIRKDDIFGRYGGESFLLILPSTNLGQGLAAANKIRAMVAANAFPFADRQPLKSLSVSGGVAEYPGHAKDAQSLLHAADDALYEAKRLGRNRVAGAAATLTTLPYTSLRVAPAPSSTQVPSL